MVTTPTGSSRGGGRDGGRGEEEEDVSVENKEVDVIVMERKQMIMDVLALPCRCCQSTDDNMRLRRWMDKRYFVKVVMEQILLQISDLIKGMFGSQSVVVVVVVIVLPVVQIMMGVVLYVLNNKNTNTNTNTMNYPSTLFLLLVKNGEEE